MGVDPRSLIERLGRDIAVALGDRLLGLYVHGSWVLGDFDAERSDVDLLAVLADDPSDLLGLLLSIHDRVVADLERPHHLGLPMVVRAHCRRPAGPPAGGDQVRRRCQRRPTSQ